MCTAIAKRGRDLIFGYNLDIDPAVWRCGIYKTERYFTVGITVGQTRYFTHGVNRDGQFGDLPYMNGEAFPAPRGAKRERLDLMVDRYIRGKYTFSDLERILRTKTVVSPPAATMHSLFGNRDGELLLVEPGYGYKRVAEDFAVLTNFPALTPPDDLSDPFYGKARYDRACALLRESDESFSVADALSVLAAVRQTGQWGTRVSFVYSRNENAVYYCLDGDFSDIRTHTFTASPTEEDNK